MARALRVAFRHHQQFRWEPDPSLTRISIFDEWPLAAAAYPRVVVSTGSANLLAGHRGIGDEFATQDLVPISVNGVSRTQVSAEMRSGTNNISVSLTVQARSMFEALQIADWCALFIRNFAVDKFQREGLYVSDMTSSPPVVELLGSDPVYTVIITVSCLTEFTRRIPISVQQTVDGMCLVGVFSSLPDGSTYGETYS
jgi:hypothetical protein